ncbi:MAG: type VI secretion system protein TssL, short form [Pseudomonas sp.]
MSLITSKKQPATAVDLDALLQDSYLLVVELRQSASLQDIPNLWERCVKQIEQVQQSLEDAKVNTRSIELISHAQCALLDESALGCAKDEAHAKWASEPLQAKFFGRHQAGEFLYEDMRQTLRQPAPDPLVLTAFQRVLMLGFQGRYRDVNDPEREQLLADLNAQVTPLAVSQPLTIQSTGHRLKLLRWLHPSPVHLLVAGLVLAGAWWGLEYWLRGLAASFVHGQV